MLDSILSKVIDSLSSVVQEELKLLFGAEENVKKLSRTLTLIKPVLDDAEQKQLREKRVGDWLRKLKDLAHDAEDIIDQCIAKGLISEEEDDDADCTQRIKSKLCCCSPNHFSFRDVGFRRDISIRVKDLIKRLDEIVKEKDRFKFREGSSVGDVRLDAGERPPPTTSLVDELEVVGRDVDKQIVIRFLLTNVNPGLPKEELNSSGHERISTVAIVGIGGLGKTTLAQLAYNDSKVKAHFDLKMWVCVSDDFDLKKITTAIIEEASGDECNVQGLNLLQVRLRNIVRGKIVLLVLDDVWNENQEKWEALMIPFRSCGEGSRLLVTTRSLVVSTALHASTVYKLKELSDDECWSLFRRRAFGDREADPVLEPIGREIVQKCNGVPLAAKSLGSLLRMKRTKHEWLYVKESELWSLPESDENRILPALRLSYCHLPSHLKRCFAYCSVFPKDYPIERQMLIELWMAEGFIVSDGRREMEDIGNEYFNDLLWRSFFQDVWYDRDGNICGCKMHDLVHDLARSASDEDCSFVGEAGESGNVFQGARHLSLVKQERLQTILDAISYATSIRTFLVFWGTHTKLHNPYGFSLHIGDAAGHLMQNCRFLRVLDLGGTQISCLPDSIGGLKLLRYLDVSLTPIKVLPESLSKLCNLQTLKVMFCKRLLKLPKALGNMVQLRHLLFDFCDSISYLPTGINRLTRLQTLHTFIVGKGSGCNNINELNGLNSLRGQLKITNLENVACKKDAEAANLVAKSNFLTLKLAWRRHAAHPSTVVLDAEGILEALQPPVFIKRLDITNYIGPNFPTWLGNALLSNLVEIVLDGASQCKHLPTLGNLSHLKYLSITGMNSVKFVGHEFYGNGMVKGFPSLKRLEFCAMDEWEEWSGLDGILNQLQALYIRECPKLRSISNVLEQLTSLQCLWIVSCHGLITLPERLEHLNSLVSLRFVDCPSLIALSKGLQRLPALQYLEISQCTGLTTLPWQLQYLTSLRAMVIDSCPKLMMLDKLMKYDKNPQHFARLESLVISHCYGLIALPEEIGYLLALKYLEISYCTRVAALPVGILQLIHLQTLQINGCPYIEKRLLELMRDEWSVMKHIPKIEINYRRIQ